MFETMHLRLVQDHQEALRREADERRLVAVAKAIQSRPERARRALRFRPSLAA